MKIVSSRDWFASKRHPDGVTQYWEPYVDPVFQANLWHVSGRDTSLLIDTGMGIASLRQGLPELDDDALTVVATHAHIDHMGGAHEWETRIVHSREADDLAKGPAPMSLRTADWPQKYIAALADEGYDLGDILVTALPSADFDLTNHHVPPAPATRIVEDGDTIDLGDRNFEVLHLPGHSPGGIGLFEAATGILFAGDAVYDGPLLDTLDGSNVEDYLKTMRRLRDLPVSIIHAGHEASFSRERLIELCDQYIRSREET